MDRWIVRDINNKFKSDAELDAARQAQFNDGAMLRKIQQNNEGYDALWPEDQYPRRDSGYTRGTKIQDTSISNDTQDPHAHSRAK